MSSTGGGLSFDFGLMLRGIGRKTGLIALLTSSNTGSLLSGGLLFVDAKVDIDLARRRQGGNGMLEYSLADVVVAFEHDHVLVKRFYFANEFDAVDQEYRD